MKGRSCPSPLGKVPVLGEFDAPLSLGEFDAKSRTRVQVDRRTIGEGYRSSLADVRGVTGKALVSTYGAAITSTKVDEGGDGIGGATIDNPRRWFDGRLELAFATSRRIHQGRAARRTRRGQALFQVAKDKNRPFIVSSGDAIVRAVGTQFRRV